MEKKSKYFTGLIILFFLTSFTLTGLGENYTKNISSKIIDVVVYPKWAYVTRSASINPDQGETKYSFKNLPSWIDKDSIRVRLESSSGNTILGTWVNDVKPSQADIGKIITAQKEVTDLQDQIQDLQSELKILDQERKYLYDLKVWKIDKIPHESAARVVNTQELKNTKNFIFEELLKNRSITNKIQRKIRDLKPKLNERIKNLKLIKEAVNIKKKEVVVEIRSQNQKRGILFLSYLISGASWYPTYDARTDSKKEKIQFSCKAIVQQTTGENWNNATFILSTVQPYLLREKPTLEPLVVDKPSITRSRKTYQVNEKLKQLNDIESSQNTFLYKQQEQSNIQGFLDNIQQARKIIKEVEERGTTIELKIDGRYSVASDGKPVKLTVGQGNLNSRPFYTAIPSISKSTYITSFIENSATFPLLPGTVKIYLDRNYIGKSKISFIAKGEEFELYLGFEEQIKVIRELDFKMSSGTFSGKKKRLTIAYNILVKNFLDSEASIEIQDQIPLSQNKEIKIRLLDSDPQPNNNQKGIVNWILKLSAGGEKKIYYNYQIEYPKEIPLQNMLELEKKVFKKK